MAGDWYAAGPLGSLLNGTTQFLVAPLNLPHQATLTDLTCYVMDNEAAANLSASAAARLTKWTYGAGAIVNNVGFLSLTTTGAGQATQTKSAALSEVFTDTSGGYYLNVTYSFSTTATGANSFYGCRITYTTGFAD